MQINTNLHQLDSLEYKLILNPKEFSGSDVNKDRTKVLETIVPLVENLNLKFEESFKDPKVKNVWYLDTKNHDLYKENNFIIRLKKKATGNTNYDITFKSRHDDKLSTLNHDLKTISKGSIFKVEKQKFEEDILYGSFKKYSFSTELEYKTKPPIKTWNDITTIFFFFFIQIPLEDLLLTVNNLILVETSHDLGKIVFKDNKMAELEFSIWCVLQKDEITSPPVIGEFDIDVRGENLEEQKQEGVVDFANSLVENINTLFQKLQKDVIVNTNLRTKTEYVYYYTNQ